MPIALRFSLYNKKNDFVKSNDHFSYRFSSKKSYAIKQQNNEERAIKTQKFPIIKRVY